MDTINIENLALSGGGLKGIAYGGCLQALDELGILKRALSASEVQEMWEIGKPN